MTRRCGTMLAALLIGAVGTAAASAETQLERGRYLATIIDCGGCHTTSNAAGKPDSAAYLAGSDIGWASPAGVYWPSNITPDPETGIGRWSTADIVKLLRTGITPDGREVAPMMPWHAYRAMTDPDMLALAAFLKTVPPVHHAVPGPARAEDVKTPVRTIAVLGKP